jgi:hypothetical protein
MTDTKTIIMKKELINKMQKRINSMKAGEEIKSAEFIFMALNDGFSYGVVKTFLESYSELGILDLTYKNSKVYIVKKMEIN